jgi:hypothetical protein
MSASSHLEPTNCSSVIPVARWSGAAGSCLTNAGLKDLAALTKLHTLYLNDTGVTDSSELKRALPKCKIMR